MTTSYAKEPTLNTILFNKREYCYHEKLNSLKIFENKIFDTLKENNSGKIIMPSKVGNGDVLKKKLIKLFESWSNGIHLEKLHDSFFLHFGHSLVPQDYGFSDIVNLLTHYKDILTLKKGPNNSILVVRVDTNIAKNENSISEEIRSQIENEEKAIPDEVMNVFIAIFSSYGGGIPLDNLLPEYEIRCGKKLSLKEFNMKSIFELVSYLGPRFQLCDVNKSQSVLYDSEELHDCPCKNSLYSNNIVSNNEGTKMDELSRGKELANELFIRLVDILVTEFPQGLYLEELLCAYKGFYDAYTKEFEPFSSLEDLKNLLENEKGFFNFIRQHGKIFVTAGAFYQDRLKDATMSLNIVSFSSSYQSVDLSVLKEGSYIDINVADIYNPKKFWIFYIDYGTNDSVSLYSLYYLHRKFFDLPAQAIKENKNLHVTLYDTVGEKEVNVNQYLVDNGYAALAEETLKSYVKDELIGVRVDVDDSKVCNSTVKTNIYEEFNDSDKVGKPLKQHKISNLYDSLVHSNGGSPSKNIIDSAIKDDAIPLLNGLSFNSSSVGSENRHLDISSQKDGTVKSPNMPTLKSRINTSFPIEKDLPVHSSMEEKENGEQYNNGQFLIQNNSPVIRSRNASNQIIKSDENVIDFQYNDSESIKPISVWNPMIDDCAQEVFYSDDDASSSSLNCEPECELLTPFHLPNGHIIHIIFLNSIHYVPFPELPLILDPSSISKLETSLCQEEERNSFTLSISRRKDIYIYMLLAREGVPYVFSPKGFVPKTISLLSLDYLIHFMNLDVENSSMEFVDLIRVHLNIRYQSHKPASYLEGLNTSATNTPRPTLSAKDKSNSLESGSKKLLKLNKAISLPSNLDICSDHNEEFSSAINVVGNSNGSIVPSVDNISMSRMGTKYNVSNNAGTSTCYDITKELAKGREKQDNLFVNSLPDKTLISQDCNKNGTYNDQYQNVDMQINNKSPLNDSNLSYIQELNYSKVSEENAIKDKNGSNPESGINLGVRLTLQVNYTTSVILITTC
ncbi:hypothetical protein Avbf_01665 [Armadillidium vulgare]|nr:hypothetical protein Avbf_01665 [Armadillidium vulgare]